MSRAVRLALAFLTVIPVRFREGEVSDEDLAASRYAYPLVGGAIGAMLAGLSWGLARVGAAPGVAAFLLIATGVALTGGLHLDGLADTADGLFLGGDAGRRLAVMRDPHVGSFGVAAVVLAILGPYAVLSVLDHPARGWVVLGTAVVGRSLVLVSAGLAGYARREGTGRVLIEATRAGDALLGAAVVLVVGGVVAGRAGLFGAAAALGLAVGLTRLASARLGGVTGDTLGALVVAGEGVFLLAVAGVQGSPA